MESEVTFLIMKNLSAHCPQQRIVRAVLDRAKVTFGDHFRHQQNEQFVMQAEQSAEQNEAGIAPVARDQRSAEFAQDTSHKPGVFLFFFDKEIDRGLVYGV